MSSLPTPSWTGASAVLFDLDGVLTPTAEVHRAAWRDTFTRVLAERGLTAPYTDADYFDFIDGKPRLDGVRSFLASRGITVGDTATETTVTEAQVTAIGDAKQSDVVAVLERDGVAPYPGSSSFLAAVLERGLAVAVVSSSNNANLVLRAAGLAPFFTVVVDGTLAEANFLPGKPAPDTYEYAASLLGLPDSACIVVEDAVAGVRAGAAGGFHSVIGVNRGVGAPALLADGASYVVDDLSELVPAPPVATPNQAPTPTAENGAE